MDVAPPSRIDAARSRAATAKRALAVGAAGTCAFLVLFLRAGDSGTAAGSTQSGDNATGSELPYDDSFGDDFFGGGSICAARTEQRLPASAVGDVVTTRRFRAMGCEIVVAGGGRRAFDAIVELFDERDRIFSRFRPDSELNRVNAATAAIVPVSRSSRVPSRAPSRRRGAQTGSSIRPSAPRSSARGTTSTSTGLSPTRLRPSRSVRRPAAS